MWFLSNLHIYCFSSFLNFVLLIFSDVCLSHQSRWTFALVMLGKKQTSTMYFRSSFHHHSKLAPFFLFYRKLIGEIECIRDLFLLVFESSGLCLSAFIKLKILFKWFKNWEQVCNGVRYRRYGCCPHWEFIIVHVDACHLNLNCQPQIGPLLLFYWFFFNNRSGSIWFTLIIFVLFRLFYPFRLSCSSTVESIKQSSIYTALIQEKH